MSTQLQRLHFAFALLFDVLCVCSLVSRCLLLATKVQTYPTILSLRCCNSACKSSSCHYLWHSLRLMRALSPKHTSAASKLHVPLRGPKQVVAAVDVHDAVLQLALPLGLHVADLK